MYDEEKAQGPTIAKHAEPDGPRVVWTTPVAAHRRPVAAVLPSPASHETLSPFLALLHDLFDFGYLGARLARTPRWSRRDRLRPPEPPPRLPPRQGPPFLPSHSWSCP